MFIVIGGNPFRSYTGTGTVTALRIVGTFSTVEKAKQECAAKWDECGGLLIVVDGHTGKEV